MPNQPKTPTRSIRVDPEDWARAAAALGESGRTTADAIRTFVAALGVSGDAEFAAFEAAEEAGWFDVHMPREEAHRRLAAALDAARPHLWREWSEVLSDDLAEHATTAHLLDGNTVVVPLRAVKQALRR